MSLTYVDSSCWVALAMAETSAGAVVATLAEHSSIVGSNLVEAEVRSALRREAIEVDPERLLEPVQWLHPSRGLGPELDRVLAVRYLRGADAWHLAHALWLAPDAKDLTFLTLDTEQRAAALALGFAAPDLESPAT